MSTSIATQFDYIKARILELPPSKPSALAAVAAERLIRAYLARPPGQQLEFVSGWAAIIFRLVEEILSPSSERRKYLDEKLQEYYLGPYNHRLGEGALDGADEDAAASAIYALEAYCRGEPNAAATAALRLLSAAEVSALEIATQRSEDWMSPEAEARITEYQQIEIDRLDRAIALLEHQALRPDNGDSQDIY